MMQVPYLSLRSQHGTLAIWETVSLKLTPEVDPVGGTVHRFERAGLDALHRIGNARLGAQGVDKRRLLLNAGAAHSS